MKRNGTLHITPKVGGSFAVAWTPSGSPGGGRPHRAVADEAHLKEFLRALGIHEERISEALTVLHDAPGDEEIPEVWLSEEEARERGLA